MSAAGLQSSDRLFVSHHVSAVHPTPTTLAEGGSGAGFPNFLQGQGSQPQGPARVPPPVLHLQLLSRQGALEKGDVPGPLISARTAKAGLGLE